MEWKYVITLHRKRANTGRGAVCHSMRKGIGILTEGSWKYILRGTVRSCGRLDSSEKRHSSAEEGIKEGNGVVAQFLGTRLFPSGVSSVSVLLSATSCPRSFRNSLSEISFKCKAPLKRADGC